MPALIALGSNLGNRERNIAAALELITEQIGTITARAGLYQTPALLHPENPEPQPDFLNSAIAVQTALAPEQILKALLAIESKLGRERSAASKPWAARIIDLDLLAVDSVVMKTAALELPHPRLHQRDFVLRPLADVAPHWVHPVLKQSVSEMLAGS